MKKIALLGSVFAASLLPVAASAADKAGPYVAFSGHAAFTEDSDTDVLGVPVNTEFDPGFGLGVALGYDLPGNPLRLEGEMTYRYNETETSTPLAPGFTASSDIDSVAYMANAYYDFDTNSNLTPYVGAGLGVVDIDGEETAFAYQGMAGVAYSLNQSSEVYGGYRYFGSDGVDLGDGAELDYISHSAEVGYRLRF